MFGQPSNSSFGFNTSSQSGPFGQSAFSKSVSNTNFGTSTPPVFGNNSSLFNAKTVGTNPSLFGSSTSTSTFGTSTSSQSFGGFSNANAGTLFGTQQNANNNLFGSSSSSSTFGQTSKPASFGFGQPSNSSIFGQTQQQNTQQALPFGQIVSTNTGGLFGSSSGFGASTSTNNISGTVVKFNPVTGSDSMVKNGVTQPISTRHHCITCMKEYESKSLEELRLEDYSAGRKGIIQDVLDVCDKWNIERKFLDKRSRTIKILFDDLSQDKKFNDAEQRSRVTIFHPMIDTIISQLENRFVGMKDILDDYRVLQPQFLANSSISDLEQKADKFFKKILNDRISSVTSQLLSIRSTFQKEIIHTNDVKELAYHFIIQHASFSSSYADVCTALLMFLTISVAMAKAEQTFSKLKLIKNYLRSTMVQKRLNNLSLLSLENQKARKIDFDKVVE
ncbi:uncharacterized protein LOC106644328 [Copidosoma floridanum]|uniref:uncharacterized protein LOC106644328 n=1 Tax=Copidosoma floridanum TaxID=29053 RepID=UPI0006C9B9E5|nr:uncharacterized protein LOC106644328 [Copidosoma floridanum]